MADGGYIGHAFSNSIAQVASMPAPLSEALRRYLVLRVW
jgi:hypothetical protein